MPPQGATRVLLKRRSRAEISVDGSSPRRKVAKAFRDVFGRTFARERVSSADMTESGSVDEDSCVGPVLGEFGAP